MLSELEREMSDTLKAVVSLLKIDATDPLNRLVMDTVHAVIAKAEAKERETAQQAHERMLALRLAECPDDVELYR